MAKIALTTIAGGYFSTTQLNANFDLIAEHLNDMVLYRDNPAGEPNSMESTLDMNSQSLINVPAAGVVSDSTAIETFTTTGDIAAETDYAICETATGGYTVSLVDPADTPVVKAVHISKVDAANTLTVNIDGVVTLGGIAGGATSVALTSVGLYTFVCDGTLWYRVS